MQRRWITGAIAVMLAALFLLPWINQAEAKSLTPPYVIALRALGGHLTKVAVNPGHYTYIADDDGRVLVMAGTEVTATLDIAFPSVFGIDTVQDYIYVGSYVEGNPITILQGKQYLGQTDPISAVGSIAVMTPTGYAYVTLPAANAVTILSGTEVISNRILVGERPNALIANPQTGLIYVANEGNGKISILQGTSIIATATVGVSPTAIMLNPATGYIYVSNYESQTVSVLEGTSVIATIPVNRPNNIAVNPTTGLVYVANDVAKTITVLSGTQSLGFITLPDYPQFLAFNPASGYGYIVSGLGGMGGISIISGTKRIDTYNPVGYLPRSVAVDPVADLAYMALYDGRVAVLGRTEATEIVIDPAAPTTTTLHCKATHALTLEVHVPPGAITQSLNLMCSPMAEADVSPYQWGEVAFLLNVYQDGVNQEGYVFQKPIVVDVSYDPVWWTGWITESKLQLRTWNWDQQGWILSGIHFVSQDMQQNTMRYELSHFSQYALTGPSLWIYLPIIMRRGR